MRFRVRHRLLCSADEFWSIFFDEEFNQKLWKDGIEAPGYELLSESSEDNGDRRRRFRVVLPPLELPGPIAKLIKAELGYTEEGQFAAARSEYRFTQRLTVLADKVALSGTTRLEAPSANEVTRVGDLEVKVKLPLIGGLGERAAESNLRQAWDQTAKFMTRWIDERAKKATGS